MTQLRKFLVYSNIWIALAASTLALANLKTLELPVNDSIFYLVFVLFSTAAAYTFLRLVGLREKHPETRSEFLDSIRRYKWPLTIWATVLLLISIYAFVHLSSGKQFVLLLSSFLGVLYGIPFFKKDGEWRSLRHIPYVKTIWVALCWTLVTCVAAYAESIPVMVRPQDLLLAIAVFLFILGLTIPFDIRDMKWDAEIGLKTIAHKHGIDGTKFISTLVLSVYLFVAFLVYVFLPCYVNYQRFFMSYKLASFIAIIFGGLGSIILIRRLNADSPDKAYTWELDGMIIIQSVVCALVLNIDQWM